MAGQKTGRNGERIVAAIRERVINWEYPPNHLLGEEMLSQEFGVSRSPVREALRSLEAEGLVSRIPNRGYFVRQFKTDEIADLYVVRLALELFVVEHLATHPETHRAVAELAAIWRDLLAGRVSREPVAVAKTDEAFHERLAELTGNGMLLSHLHSINLRLYAFRSMDFTMVMEQGTLEASCQSHLAIIAAIASGDVEASRRTIKANIDMSHANVDKMMGRILAKSFNAHRGGAAAGE